VLVSGVDGGVIVSVLVSGVDGSIIVSVLVSGVDDRSFEPLSDQNKDY
jgi:hypothetical protein